MYFDDVQGQKKPKLKRIVLKDKDPEERKDEVQKLSKESKN
jgi:hypothetical protein